MQLLKTRNRNVTFSNFLDLRHTHMHEQSPECIPPPESDRSQIFMCARLVIVVVPFGLWVNCFGDFVTIIGTEKIRSIGKVNTDNDTEWTNNYKNCWIEKSSFCYSTKERFQNCWNSLKWNFQFETFYEALKT